MCETPENGRRSILHVALGFLLGIVICLGCLFFSVFLGAAIGMRHSWMFPVLNAIALVGSGMLALRRVNKSSYPEGVLIAVSVAFVLNVLVFAMTLSRRVE